MQQTCVNSWCQKHFEITDADLALLRDLSPMINGRVFELPLPIHCHDCALLMLQATRNERSLYRRNCDATKKEIISAYSPVSPFTVYENSVWWGDTWNPLDYGQTFDHSRPFADQFSALLRRVPREGTSIFRCQNCDYNSHTRDSKNCYMNSLVAQCEDSYYCYWVVGNHDVFDSAYTHRSTLSWGCRDAESMYECTRLEESSDCTNCHFGYELHGCKNCLLCTNLINKEYHIENAPCTKEEFEERKKAILSGSWGDLQKTEEAFAARKLQALHRSVQTNGCEDVLGDHMVQSRDCKQCFDVDRCEASAHAISISETVKVLRSHSVGWPGCELVYHSAVVRGSQRILGCRYSWFSSDLLYCDSCSSCTHCLGCIGLKHREYCIFNVQYTKEEYEKMAPTIIEQMQREGLWGQPLPVNLSTFGYNETVATEYQDLTKDQAVSRGFLWSDFESPAPKASRVIAAQDLLDRLSDTPDDILNWAIECEMTKRPFKIIKQELDYYRRMNLPIPRLHPDERHRRRMAQRNPRILFARNCSKCGEAMQSTFSPERQERVVCEKCYLEEVY